jgi:hypothetical protein
LKGCRRKETWVVDRGCVTGEREQEKGRQCLRVKNEEKQNDCRVRPSLGTPTSTIPTHVQYQVLRYVQWYRRVAQQAKSVAAREAIENVIFLLSVSVSCLRVFVYECPEWCVKIGHDRLLFTFLIYYSQSFVLCWKEMVYNNVLVT